MNIIKRSNNGCNPSDTDRGCTCIWNEKRMDFLMRQDNYEKLCVIFDTFIKTYGYEEFKIMIKYHKKLYPNEFE